MPIVDDDPGVADVDSPMGSGERQGPFTTSAVK